MAKKMIKSKFKKTEIGMIPEDWEVKKLKEVTLQIFSGGTPNTKKEDYWNGNLSWLSSGETRQTFIRDTERKITKAGVDNSSTRLAKKEDIVVAGAGQGHTRGQPSFCLIDTYINQSVVALRANKEKITPFFLFYNLLSRYDELRQLSDAHSSRGSLTTKLLADLFIKLPPIEEQGVLSKILSDLDFKIELNQQMNKALEEVSRAIFKRWFVDFEFPNEKGKPYKSSGEEMIDSELGKIPKGWKVSKLEDYGTFKNGINYLRGEPGDTDFFIANVRDIANNKLLLKSSLDNIKLNMKKAKDYLLEDKDILIARSASPGEVSLVLGNLDKVIYSGFSIRYRLNNPDNYLYIFLILQGLKESLSNFAVGTTLQSVNQETLKNMRFILPPDKILREFNKIIEQIFIRTYNNLIQYQNLSQIRDLLLPKLMSGKIRVPVEEK